MPASDSMSFQIILVIGMLVTGSINTVSKKMGYATCGVSLLPDSKVTACAAGYCGEGADGQTCPKSECRSACPAGQHRFMKPWTQTLVMFAGEFMCIFVFFYKRRQYLLQQQYEGYVNEGTAMMSPADEIDSPNKKRGGFASMFSPSALFSPTHRKGRSVSKDSAYGTITCSSALVCILPAFCDVGGTTLSGIGLLFTSASVFQMLRGSIIVFTALLSVIFLKRKLWGYHYIGLLLTIAGVTLVGMSSIMGAKADTSASKSSKGTNMVFLGNIMVILSQLMSATQMVVEEKFLKGRKLPPEFVVGCEGMFGMLIMLAIILPTVSHLDGLDGGGVHEDPIDAVHLIGSNGKLFALVGAYWISIAFYNFCGLAVAKSLSSVHRCLIDACRTVLVWSVDLLLYYYTNTYGEPWDPNSSGMQLIGFGIMICGTFTYYKVVRLPFCNYEPEEAKNEDIQRLKENDELLLAEENRRNNINNARRQERGGSNQF